MLTSKASRNLLLVLLAVVISHNAHSARWDDISPEDLAATECAFDPTAPAEILYKEIIYDLVDGEIRVIKNHLITKIYEKAALDHARRTKVWYHRVYRISSIEARVIKPDGSFIEIDGDDVVTQMESKKGRDIYKSTTISIPQVEVGDIVEYKYRQTLDRGYYMPKDEVSFQEEWPIRKLYLKMKPYVYRGTGFKWTSQRTNGGMKQAQGGFYEITLENQLGYPEEPYQAPDSDAKSWFAFYNVATTAEGDFFWKSEAKKLHKEMLSKTKSDKAIDAKAAELANGLRSDEEKLRAFYDFCRTELINSRHGKADRLTQDQRDDLDDEWAAGKVLEKGYGTPRNINTVFCALARAAGIDARLSPCADRSDYAFTKVMENVEVALPDTLVATLEGENWTFYNPGAMYIPFGQLDWNHDNVGALVPDKKDLIFVRTQAALPELNHSRTVGEFQLSEDGSLKGKVTFIGDGNQGMLLKQLLDDKSESERIDGAKSVFSSMWPNATVDNIKIENADAPSGPVTIEGDVTIPNYAEAVGNRLFLQANVEERYSETEFPNPTRKTDIFFDFKYRDEADISIKLPDGYVLEAPSAPKPFAIQGFMEYSPKLALNKKSNTLVYKRVLDFHGDRHPPAAYPIVKAAFDNLLAQDQHAVTLKKEETAAASGEAEQADNS